MDANGLGNSTDSSKYWEDHYRRFNEFGPSDFAKNFAVKYTNQNSNIIELGCGNGRDALFLVEYCKNYTGLDISQTGISTARQKLENKKYHRQPQFHCADFTNTDFADFKDSKNLFYSRFTLHSITLEQQKNLFTNLLKLPAEKNVLVVETRTIYDELYGIGEEKDKDAFISDHYRRFINPGEIKSEIESNFEILEWIEGKDLARFEDENPYVLRFALKKRI
jgi:tellurite methyltransferase